MTKLLSVLLAFVVLLCLCACGNEVTETPTTSQTLQPTESVFHSQSGFVFTYQGVDLSPGKEFSEDKLPRPKYVYTQTNSTLEGTDIFYNYGKIEVTVYHDGKTAVIRSVIVISPDITTPEGLVLGDSLEQVHIRYGDSDTQNGDEWLFTKENTVLAILTQDGYVAGIEYRLSE